MTRAKDISKILTDADISGNIDVDGVTNLDVVDIDGAVDMASTLQVDGAITSSAGMTITTADNDPQLILTSTDADASSGPNILLKRDSASPADNDTVGRVKFVFDNDAGEETEAVRIDAFIPDVSDGTEDATFQELTMVGGTMRSRVEHSSTETVFNQDSVDIDFRVEGNGDTHALFVQGSDDKVGINNSSPVEMLTIGSTSDTNARIQFLTATNGANTIHFGDGTSADAYRGYINYAHDTDSLQFGSGGSERMRIHSSGQVGIGQTGNEATLCIFGHQQAYTGLQIKNGTNNGSTLFAVFKRSNGTATGSIQQSADGATTAFNTTSDYRLKESISYDFDATTRLKQLKPCRFVFKESLTGQTVDGFLAHEVSDVVSEAVTGEKDAMKDVSDVVLNSDGTVLSQGVSEEEWIKGKSDKTYASNTTWTSSKSVVDAQSIDQSKLVPLLVKTIQELEARITALESA